MRLDLNDWKSAVQKAIAGLCRFIAAVQVLTLIVMTGVMISLVFTRYTMSYSPSWTEELTRYLMIWGVMLGAVVLVVFDDHITLHILEDKIGPFLNLLRILLIRVIILGVALVTGWTGIGFVQQMSTVLSPGLGVSMLGATLPIPISMILIALITMFQIVRDILVYRGHDLPTGIAQSDLMDGSFRPTDDA